MLKKIVLFIYIIIIGIAVTIIILSNSVTETGIIAINNNALVTVDNNLLKPKIVAGDLVVVDITIKKVKEDDIISYVTLDEDKTIIRTNKIVATTKDENNNKIYSLKVENGEIENIDDSCIIGKVKTTIPFLGNILTYLMTTKGFLTVTLLPAIIILIGYIISFILSLSKRKRII